MPVQNAEIAAVFNEIADLLEIEGANAFRVRAYRNAARMLGELRPGVQALVEQGGRLEDLPGIGADLAGKIREVVRSGTCALLDRLRGEVPAGVAQLLQVHGLGPKRVRLLHHELGIQTIAQLHEAALQGRIHGIHGFGARSEQQILEATAAASPASHRYRNVVATPVADSLLAYLRSVPGVERAVAAGSLRRGSDTVGDLDLLVCSRPDGEVLQRLQQYEDLREVLAAGQKRASIVLRNGMQVDVRAVAPQEFGAAWVYFTGSRAHNIALRRLAQRGGLKINEYGVFRGRRRIAGETEQSVYRAVGLDWIEPELREDRGEIEAARHGQLPQLLAPDDLRGDLHVHTRESDGHDTLEEMAAAARRRGLGYIAITDHSRRLTVAHGLDPVRLARQIDAIDQFNERADGFRVLKGSEVDILEDGQLDLPDSILRRLDLVIGAIHYRFDLPRARQTDRILRAMDQRYFTILAHPTGRLLGSRPPMELDMLRVLRKARERGCFLEVNSNPERLDLSDVHCQMAKAEGVLLSVNSDAHATLDFANLECGVRQARRGWIGKGDVLNTRPIEELLALIARSR